MFVILRSYASEMVSTLRYVPEEQTSVYTAVEALSRNLWDLNLVMKRKSPHISGIESLSSIP